MANELAQFSEDEMEEFFQYLDNLRESGVTNMWGAPAYLVRKFKVSQQEATGIFVQWTKIFEERHRGRRWRAGFGRASAVVKFLYCYLSSDIVMTDKEYPADRCEACTGDCEIPADKVLEGLKHDLEWSRSNGIFV